MRRPSCISVSLLTLAAVAVCCPAPSSAQTGEQPPANIQPFAPDDAQGDDGAERRPGVWEPGTPLPSDATGDQGAADRTGEPPAATAETPPAPAETPAATAETPPADPAPPAAQTGAAPAPAIPAPVTTVEPAAPAPPVQAVEEQPAAKPGPLIDPKDILLKIATWGGAYAESQERAFFKPFTARQGYQIESVTYDGTFDALRAQSREPQWSLVDLDGETMSRACGEQLLEPLDAQTLQTAPDGASASEDFLPGAIQPCGIASVAWSAVIVYDDGLKRKPDALADFFNTRKVPGKRLLPKQPRYTLELALMADGAAPQEVYALLDTQDGQDRALAKLSTIRDDILWWAKPSEVFGRIAQKEAAMALAFNGRAFMAIVGSRQPLGILWDGQMYAFDYWAIPRGAPHIQAAKEFIRFATAPGQLADQTRWMPYGPARRSAVRIVGKHGELDLDMKPFLPTYEPNLKNALAFDGAWWSRNEQALVVRFNDWLEGRRQLPTRKEDVTSQ